MKDVYLRAAERTFILNSMSCCAVADIVSPNKFYYLNKIKEVVKYRKLFAPSVRGIHGVWGNDWSIYSDEVKQCRVLALLFMHWIEKSKEPKK